LGKEIVREILEEEKKIWNATSLVNYIHEKTGKCRETGWNYLRHYRHGKKGDKYNKTVKDGVVHIKKGNKRNSESLFYAEKYQQEIDKEMEIVGFEDIINFKINKQQELINENKEKFGGAFENWLQHKIKQSLDSLPDGFEYEVEMSKKVPFLVIEFLSLENEKIEELLKYNRDYKDYRNFISDILNNKHINEGVKRDLIADLKEPQIDIKLLDEITIPDDIKSEIEHLLWWEDEIVFIDAALTHPDEEIRKKAWELFIECKGQAGKEFIDSRE